MWSTNKRDQCLRSSLLIINCAACIAVIYLYITYADKQENIDKISSGNLIQQEKLIHHNCTPVCVTRACIWHANMFLKNGNSAVDPCENFRSFLCDGFQKQFGSEEKANVMSETNEPMIRNLKGILDNLQAEPGSASAKMKTVYDSCVNYGSSELAGIRDLKNFLKNLGFLDWPNLAYDFNFSDVSLPMILGNFFAYGNTQYVFLRRVRENQTVTDRLRVSFSDYLFNKTTGFSENLAVGMLKYFDLETNAVDTIIKDYEHSNGKCYENCTEVYVDCSQENDVGWHDFCELLGFFNKFMNFNDKFNISTIVIEEPEDGFFKKLFPLLHSISSRALANFFALSFLQGYQGELNFYFRFLKLKHKAFIKESDMDMYELDRWKYCVRWIADNMRVILENEFLNQYLTNTVTEEIINIYNDYSSDVTDLITLQEWIPNELKSRLTGKLKNITFNIELLSRILPNDTYVNKGYEKFHPTSESFFNNVLQLKRVAMNNPFSISFFSSIEEYAPYITAFDVQATAGGPYIEIHFGMLIPPFYIPGHINLINRVLLAPIIGHEFGHFIFSMIGSELEDDKIFSEKRQCIWDQFSKFKFENLNENLNGSLYDTENFPDNIGTALIDKIIERYSTSEGFALPGLSYSTEQLLYMSATQMWCSKSNLEKDLHHKNIDSHAPTEFRLLGIVQNSRGHPGAFHCSDGSFMNPTTKCSLLD